MCSWSHCICPRWRGREPFRGKVQDSSEQGIGRGGCLMSSAVHARLSTRTTIVFGWRCQQSAMCPPMRCSLRYYG